MVILALSFANSNGSGSGSTGQDGSFGFDTVCGPGTLGIVAGLTGATVPTGFQISGSASAADGQQWQLRLPPVVQARLTVVGMDLAPVAGAVIRQTSDPTVAADPASVLDGAEPFNVTMQLEDRTMDAHGAATITTSSGVQGVMGMTCAARQR